MGETPVEIGDMLKVVRDRLDVFEPRKGVFIGASTKFRGRDIQAEARQVIVQAGSAIEQGESVAGFAAPHQHDPGVDHGGGPYRALRRRCVHRVLAGVKQSDCRRLAGCDAISAPDSRWCIGIKRS